jgi:hypothetical protein
VAAGYGLILLRQTLKTKHTRENLAEVISTLT